MTRNYRYEAIELMTRIQAIRRQGKAWRAELAEFERLHPEVARRAGATRRAGERRG